MNDFSTRELRIFISSTFEDLKKEREVLMTKVFPPLIQKAKSRGVTLTPIDLRWGIISEEIPEEKLSARVVDICLNEIEKAQCFIGIIGNRCGWCPQPEELKQSGVLDKQQELSYHSGMSITELEMQYGIFLHKEQGTAFFFVKDESQATDIPNKELRDKIYQGKNDDYYEVYDYSSLDTFSSQIETVVNNTLDRLFPGGVFQGSQLEDIDQQCILKSYTKFYIPRKKLFNKIDKGIKENQVVLVTGDIGMGKSSLIANWIDRQSNSDIQDVVYHFTTIGGANTPQDILRRLCRKVSELIGEELDGIQLEGSLSDLLSDLCRKISKDRQLVLALDGLSETSILVAGLFAGLLSQLPDNVKVLVSARINDENYMWAKTIGAAIVEVKNLDWEQRDRFIRQYLKNYGKKLEEKTIGFLSQAFEGGPLLLRILLDILVTFGDFETVKELIHAFSLTHPVFKRKDENEHRFSMDDMEELIFESIEDDIHFGRQESKITRFYNELLNLYESHYSELPVNKIVAAFTFISFGFKENEITDFVNITPLDWSFFKSFFGHFFNQRDGFLFLNNDDIRNAAIERYHDLAPDMFSHAAEFFDKDDGTLRSYGARLSHDAYIKDVNSLIGALQDADLFRSMHRNAGPLFAKYWDAVIAEGLDTSIIEDYVRLLTTEEIDTQTEDVSDKIDLLHDVARFYIDYMCNGELAIDLIEHAESLCSSFHQKDYPLNLDILRTKAEALILDDNDEAAVEILNTIIEEYKVKGDVLHLAESYRLRGEAFSHLEKDEEALEDAITAMSVLAEANKKEGHTFMMCLLSIGRFFLQVEEYDEAIDSMERAFYMSINLYGRMNMFTALILEEMAIFYYEMEHYNDAFTLISNAINIYESILLRSNAHLAYPHYLKGLILMKNNYEEPYNDHALEEIKMAFEILFDHEIRNEFYFRLMNLLMKFPQREKF